ncbi:S46 family peptidase [bacterium]|nr:S46 family peptidase [bacterium]
MKFATSAIVFCVLLTLAAPLTADEGPWTFHNPPLDKIRERYGVMLTSEWLDHLRLSSARLSDGGSASWVSADGLLLTNHHVAAACIQGLSSEAHDYMKDGYGTSAPAEARCPGLDARTLMSMEDVSRRVIDAGLAAEDEAAGKKARKEESARIETECTDATGLLCEVVELYGGGEYWIYRYKRWEDVRLVFAPEGQLGFFGGDPDNFNYPRFCLDNALMRVYDADGKPVAPPAYLRVATQHLSDGDAIFISGHPATSERRATLAQLEFLRDVRYPFWKEQLRGRLDVIDAYSARGEESAREAKLLKFGVENSLKVITGYLRGLGDPRVMEKKAAEHDALRTALTDANLLARYDAALADIARAQQASGAFYERRQHLRLWGSGLFSDVHEIVMLTGELQKPNGERFEEYRDANVDSLKHKIGSEAPVYKEFEAVLLTAALTQLRDGLGENDPLVRKVLDGREPAEVARQVMDGTKLDDAKARVALMKKGRKAVEKSKDPLVRLALAIEPEFRVLRERYDREVESVEERAAETLAAARFAAFGRTVYPDTTFTLRLAFGRVSGYFENEYTYPAFTTYHGLFDRNLGFADAAPYDLPERWQMARDRIDLATPFNFVSTADTFPGNSGSPVVNANGELVGTLFDGNMASLAIQYVYEDRVSRSIAVDIHALIEALGSVYGRTDLLNELTAAPGEAAPLE